MFFTSMDLSSCRADKFAGWLLLQDICYKKSQCVFITKMPVTYSVSYPTEKIKQHNRTLQTNKNIERLKIAAIRVIIV